jgi:signal transduction histidine kinase
MTQSLDPVLDQSRVPGRSRTWLAQAATGWFRETVMARWRDEARPAGPGLRDSGAALNGCVFSAAGLAAALVQLAFAFPALGFPPRWMFQVLFLAAVWTALSLAHLVLRSGPFARIVYASFRFVVYEILVYPLGGAASGIALTLLCALVSETVMTLNSPADIVFPIAFIALALIRPANATAWDRAVAPYAAAQALGLAFLPLMVVFALRFYKAALTRARRQKALIERLKRSGLDLIDTNILLQERIVHQEARLLEMERGRISRELHDTIGYTLMNILAMQKAAASILSRDPERAREFIAKTIEQSERGLHDTREAIGALRGRSEGKATIAEAVTRLAVAFDNTHIRIAADLNNSAPSYGPVVDDALGHFVQEAITNAIKHGNADDIVINFWRTGEGLTVSVRDNGTGLTGKARPVEGIGIRGMNERLGGLGGGVSMGNAFGGFRISAFVPSSAYREWV